ncbi:MAG TPA: RNase adapter RapZ [Tenuifilaceae bacterium]|nr:RNase adapter RapZ [Tenuifilaceae bacterium]
MINAQHIEELTRLFYSYFKSNPKSVLPLPQSGSNRMYYRLGDDKNSAIGAFCSDVREVETFVYLSDHFHSKGISVPRVLLVSPKRNFYLQSDLGKITLFDIITQPEAYDKPETLTLLEQAITDLASMQFKGFEGLDKSKLYIDEEAQAYTVLWDLNYFKYNFLKLAGINFDELRLEKVFQYLSGAIKNVFPVAFQYRDFQSRNIMVQGNKLFYIDFQGGRVGPVLYDVASFLYQAKAKMPDSVREHLLNRYINSVSEYVSINKRDVRDSFILMSIFRIVQTLGAYGFRGIFEHKAHFIESLPYALNNLLNLVDKSGIKEIDYLKQVLEPYANELRAHQAEMVKQQGLTVSICSFSFKKGYPQEHSVHGGGFVFDCRSLPNPGRLDEYKSKTGQDVEVIRFLEGYSQVDDFLKHVWALISPAISNYQERNFDYLSVSFGCTGGQHRSVYCAEYIARLVKQFFRVNVTLKHREI